MDFPIDISNYVNLKLNGKEKLSETELEVLSKNIDLVRVKIILNDAKLHIDIISLSWGITSILVLV